LGSIVDDVLAAATWVSQALSSSGYRADFSASSLWELDRFFDEQVRGGTAVPGGLLAEGLGQRLFSIGGYVGEVIRRHKGGSWWADESDPQAEINVQLRLTESDVCWPVQRVMKRFKNGAEDSLAAYGIGLGLDVGPKPARSRRWWWPW
jgi:hypothetical protein